MLIYAKEQLKFKKKGRYSHWQCSHYLDLNPTCVIDCLNSLDESVRKNVSI